MKQLPVKAPLATPPSSFQTEVTFEITLLDEAAGSQGHSTPLIALRRPPLETGLIPPPKERWACEEAECDFSDQP